MAKTRFSIIMDYFNALRQADKLSEAAEKLKVRKNEVERYINEVRECWTGDNASLYLAKLETSKKNIEKLSKNLAGVANIVKRIAQRTYETEMATLEISQRRNYH